MVKIFISNMISTPFDHSYDLGEIKGRIGEITGVNPQNVQILLERETSWATRTWKMLYDHCLGSAPTQIIVITHKLEEQNYLRLSLYLTSIISKFGMSDSQEITYLESVYTYP